MRVVDAPFQGKKFGDLRGGDVFRFDADDGPSSVVCVKTVNYLSVGYVELERGNYQEADIFGDDDVIHYESAVLYLR